MNEVSVVLTFHLHYSFSCKLGLSMCGLAFSGISPLWSSNLLYQPHGWISTLITTAPNSTPLPEPDLAREENIGLSTCGYPSPYLVLRVCCVLAKR